MKALTFAAIMAALANILSVPPLAIPISLGTFEILIHFSQPPIFLSGILAGPVPGLITGAVGGLYMSVTKIPFIVGGLAILGCSAGLLAKKLNSFLSGILAWSIQAPYVLVTDYVWFTLFVGRSQSVVWVILTPIMIKLTIEAVLSSFLAKIVISYIKRTGLRF